MNARTSWIRGPFLATLAVGLLAAAGTETRGAHGGGQKGHGGHAPHVAAPRQTFKPPRMPHWSAPAHMNVGHGRMSSTPARSHASNAQSHANRTPARSGHALARVNSTPAPVNNTPNEPASPALGGTVTPSTTATPNARRNLYGGNALGTYTYGYGPGASRYRAYGYGRGYRNRYYGGGYGYGRWQGNNRAIVARLRSVHASLARLDHDYLGHRVRAMHAISMAIRQLSHRSMVYSGVGFAPRLNNLAGAGMGMGGRRSVLGGAGRGGPRLPQAVSDARMSQALRNLQGIGMQLANQGNQSMGHGRALGHIHWAIRELNVALSIR
jgi:hypothetical protein